MYSGISSGNASRSGIPGCPVETFHARIQCQVNAMLVLNEMIVQDFVLYVPSENYVRGQNRRKMSTTEVQIGSVNVVW